MYIIKQLFHFSINVSCIGLVDDCSFASDLGCECTVVLYFSLLIVVFFCAVLAIFLQGVSQKSKTQLESLRKLADHSRNYHEYRSRLRNTSPPAVPFLGAFFFWDG